MGSAQSHNVLILFGAFTLTLTLLTLLVLRIVRPRTSDSPETKRDRYLKGGREYFAQGKGVTVRPVGADGAVVSDGGGRPGQVMPFISGWVVVSVQGASPPRTSCVACLL